MLRTKNGRVGDERIRRVERRWRTQVIGERSEVCGRKRVAVREPRFLMCLIPFDGVRAVSREVC